MSNILAILPGEAPLTMEGMRDLSHHVYHKAEEVASEKYRVRVLDSTLEQTLSLLGSSWGRMHLDARINSANFPHEKRGGEITMGFSVRPYLKNLKHEDARVWALKKSGARRLAWPFEVACWALQYPEKFTGVDIWCLFPPRLLEVEDGRLFWHIARFDSCYGGKPDVVLWPTARPFEESTLVASSSDLIPVVF